MTSIRREITGRAIPVRGNDIDTDRIIPARYLRCVTFEGLGEHAFEDDRKDPNHAFNQPKYRGAKILIANKNFGCGSSREHAPQAIMRWGVQGFIAESFAEIFAGNCMSLGLPYIVVSQDVAETLQREVEANPALEMTIDVEKSCVRVNGKDYPGQIPAGVREQLLKGTWDALGQLLEGEAAVRRIDAALDYPGDRKGIKRTLGSAKGQITWSDDFNEPLADFDEYS